MEFNGKAVQAFSDAFKLQNLDSMVENINFIDITKFRSRYSAFEIGEGV
jgi:hypothetical protein